MINYLPLCTKGPDKTKTNVFLKLTKSQKIYLTGFWINSGIGSFIQPTSGELLLEQKLIVFTRITQIQNGLIR